MAIKTTMTKIPKDVLLTGLIENLGVLSAAEYTSLLGKIKVVCFIKCKINLL